MAESVSILNKISDITVDKKTFQNTDNGEMVEYDRITAHILVGGQEEKVELVPAKAEGKSAYKLLKLADDVE